jgi:hypothetical protein
MASVTPVTASVAARLKRSNDIERLRLVLPAVEWRFTAAAWRLRAESAWVRVRARVKVWVRVRRGARAGRERLEGGGEGY